MDAAASVRILARLHDPERIAIPGELVQYIIVLWVVKGFLKLEEFSIILTLFDVIS